MGECFTAFTHFIKPIMRNSEFYPAHVAGETVDAYFNTFHKKNARTVKLIQFIDFARDNRNNIVRRLPNNKNEHAFIKERWLCEYEGQVVECMLQQLYEEAEYPLADRGRLPGQYPDNEMEVNLLTDSYPEFLTNTRNLHHRDPQLQSVQQRADLRLQRLKELFELEQDPTRKDLIFNIILHKETPCNITLRRIKKLKSQYPAIFSSILNSL